MMPIDSMDGGGSSAPYNGIQKKQIISGDRSHLAQGSYTDQRRSSLDGSPADSFRLAKQRDIRHIAICATDLTFLWSGCRRCAYNKIVRGIKQPRGGFPAIFSNIDAAMKSYLDGCRTEVVGEDAGLPPGQIAAWSAKKWVRSRDLFLPEHPEIAINLYGQPDAIIRLDEAADSGAGNASAVCDYKTSHIACLNQKMYSLQLHAYAIAAEQPAGGYLSGRLEQVARLGLLVFEPSRFKIRSNAAGAPNINGYLGGEVAWVELRRDDEAFFEFLAEVVAVLKREAPPEPSPACSFCSYAEQIYRAYS